MVARATNYTVNPLVDRAGTVFTTRGAAGAVVFTLPVISPGQLVGYFVEFLNVVDQNMSIVAPVADTLVTVNDAAADSVIFSTSNQKIGARALAQWDGTQWSVANQSVACTMTVNT
jgi:hypothetical protein